MRDGERAGGWQSIHVVAAFLLVAGTAVQSVSVIVDLFGRDADTGRPDPSQALPTLLFAAVWLTFTWRLMRMGLYYSDKGVRIRTLPRTVTYPWAEITTVGARGDNLRLVLADGREVETPVRRREPGSGRRHGVPLAPGDFTIMIDRLQDHVRAGR